MIKLNRQSRLLVTGLVVVLVVFFSIFFTVTNNIKAKVPQFTAKVATITTKDTKISYYTRGSGDVIVLIPGFGMTMQHWDPLLLEGLSQHHKLVIFDYRGIGGSVGSLDTLSEKQMSDDTIALLDALKIKKANILGWSSGSFVAQVIAEQHPDRVNKLILIGTAPGGNQIIQSSQKISDTIQNNLGGSWQDVYVPFMFASEDERDGYLARLTRAKVQKEIPSGPEESVEAKIAYEKVFSNTKEERARQLGLATIKAETLLITGLQDKLLIPENAQRVANQIPNSKLILVQNAGHAVLFEKAEEVTKYINDYLKPKPKSKVKK